MRTVKSYQEQVQDVVEKVIATVEEQYKELAATTFTYVEKVTNVDSVKAKHDEVANLACTKAREVNKLIGEKAGELILKFEKPETKVEKVKTTAKKAKATTKKAATTAKKKATAAKTKATKVAKDLVDQAEEATA
ncbi:hypothetical protein [Alkalimarinus sediminis]|uniref:Uncharacterized protein n=1 Tax=Alkalimarinus sediminis TaxID=1632866 RepID=A0A9E8HF77_9ALTE|nr:hypothetical protein [Alkalimarinus sediminis]UZW73344.1 hypothetical protein NNL22_09785 [Alkalimarinus sediminis]